MAIRLIHIAPELPPTVGGVADYTSILSRRVTEIADREVEVVLIHAGNEGTDATDVAFPVANLSGKCSAHALADSINRLADEAGGQAAALLEYSGYGYEKRGVPFWLIRGLRQARSGSTLPLITMFHEISASGPIWSSAFWLSSVQSYVARSIAQASDGLMTTHPTLAGQLRNFRQEETPVRVSPAFSNVGEPAYYTPFSERQNQAVVFGGNQMKTALYESYTSLLRRCIRTWDIERIVDIGGRDIKPPSRIGVHVEALGILPAHEIQDLLLASKWGILQYPAAYSTKSGIMAAYMAHGISPVLVAPEPQEGLLKPDEHYVSITTGRERLPDAAECGHIARTAAEWYEEYGHSRCAAKTACDLLFS